MRIKISSTKRSLRHQSSNPSYPVPSVHQSIQLVHWEKNLGHTRRHRKISSSPIGTSILESICICVRVFVSLPRTNSPGQYSFMRCCCGCQDNAFPFTNDYFSLSSFNLGQGHQHNSFSLGYFSMSVSCYLHTRRSIKILNGWTPYKSQLFARVCV